MDLRSLLAPLVRKFWLLLLVALLTGGTSALWAATMSRPVHIGELFVTITSTDSQDTPDYKYGNYYANFAGIEFARTVSGWFSSGAFIDRIYTEARVDRSASTDLLSRLFGPISVSRVERANLQLSIRAQSHEDAERLVAAARTVLSERIQEYNTGAATRYAAVNPTAGVHTQTANPVERGILGLIAGVVLGIICVYLLEAAQGVVQSPAQFETALGAPATFALSRHDGTLATVLATHIATRHLPLVVIGASIDPSGLVRGVARSLAVQLGKKLTVAAGHGSLRLGGHGSGWSDDAKGSRGPVRPSAKLIQRAEHNVAVIPYGRTPAIPVARILGAQGAQLAVVSFPEGAASVTELQSTMSLLVVAQLGRTRTRDLVHLRTFIGDRPVTSVLLT